MIKALIHRLRSNHSLALFRRRLLTQLRRHLFGYLHLHPSSYLVGGSNISRDLATGQFCFIHTDCYIGPMVRLGNYVMIGPRVGIVGADHATDIPGTPMVFAGRPEPKETLIGDDVWIGFGSIIMAGVRIGNGAIIGAGTVVTRDVGDYEVHVGVPNRRVGDRFEGEVRAEHEAMLHQPPTQGRYCQPKMV